MSYPDFYDYLAGGLVVSGTLGMFWPRVGFVLMILTAFGMMKFA